MEDIATPRAQGVNIRSGTVLKPNADIWTTGFQDATDQEAPGEVATWRYINISMDGTMSAQEKVDTEPFSNRDYGPYPNHKSDTDHKRDTAANKYSPTHTKSLRDYSYQIFNT